MSRFESVADHRGAFGVKRLCTVLNLPTSGFYRWLKTAPARAAKQAAGAALTRQIRKVHAESGKTYGAKRSPPNSARAVWSSTAKRTERLMRQHAIQVRRLKRRHRTTIPDPAAQAVPDLLRRDFTASAPNRAWGRRHHLSAHRRLEVPVSGHRHRRVLPSPTGLVDG